MRQFQELTKMLVQMHFFAPNHGHSQCDGHLGAISRSTTTQSKGLAESGVLWNPEWVRDIIANLKHTHVFDSVIHSEGDLVKTLEGVRKYLVFSFDSEAGMSVDCRPYVGGDVTRLTFRFPDPEPQE